MLNSGACVIFRELACDVQTLERPLSEAVPFLPGPYKRACGTVKMSMKALFTTTLPVLFTDVLNTILSAPKIASPKWPL